MAEVASAYVSLIPSFAGGTGLIAKELDGPAEAAGRSAGGRAGEGFKGQFAGALRGVMAPLAGLFAGVQVAQFFGDSIQAASGLGESINALNVTYGDASGGVQELGKSAAESLGLSNLEFNNLAVRFGSFTKTIAGDGGDVVGTLDDLTGRASDFASVMNLDVAEAARLFQSGLAGESEPLRQFGIDMSAAAVQSFAYSNGIAESGKKLTEAQKVQARYGLLMQQTSATQGDFANTSDSLANQQRILASRFEDTKARVGTALLPAMQGLTGFITGTVLPGFEKLTAFFAEKVVPGFKALIDLLVGGDFTAAFGEVFGVEEDSGLVNVLFNVRDAAMKLGTFVTGTLVPGIASLVGWLKENQAWLAPIAVGVLAMVAAFKAYQVAMMIARVATAAFAVVQGILNVVMAANPIGIVVLALIGLVAALVYAWNNSETFRRVVTAAWEGIKAAASAVAAFFTKTIPALWNSILAWTTAAWANIKNWLSNTWANIKTTASNVWNAILAFFRAIPGKIVQFFLNFTLPGLLIKHWSSIKDGATRGWNAVLDFIKGIPARIVAGLGNLGQLLFDAGRQILEGLKNGITNAVGGAVRAVKDAVGSVISGAKNLLGIASPSRVFMELGGYVAEGLAIGMERGSRDVEAAAGRIMDVPSVARANLRGVSSSGVPGGAGMPSKVTLVDADGSLLGHMRVMVDDQRRAAQLAGRR